MASIFCCPPRAWMWRSMTCSRESFSWLALARLKLINHVSSPGMNNLAFMRNLARFDSGITNLSPEMPNLASTRADVLSRFVIFLGGSLNMLELSDVLNEFLALPGMLVKVYRKKNKSEVVTQSEGRDPQVQECPRARRALE